MERARLFSRSIFRTIQLALISDRCGQGARTFPNPMFLRLDTFTFDQSITQVDATNAGSMSVKALKDCFGGGFAYLSPRNTNRRERRRYFVGQAHVIESCDSYRS